MPNAYGQVAMNVLNDKKVLAKLETLSTRQQKDALSKATTKGTAELRKRAKRAVPIKTGTLKRAIGSSKKSFRKGSVQYGLAGVKRRKVGGYQVDGRTVIPELYMNVLESGTVKGPRRTRKMSYDKRGRPIPPGMNRGTVKAGHFLENSAKEAAPVATRAFTQRFVSTLMKHWRANKVA